MGYIEILFKGLARPNKSLPALAKKLARNFTRHYFKHAAQQDLQDVRVYDTIRTDVCNALRTRFNLLLDGLAFARKPIPIALLTQTPSFAWC